MALSLSRSSRQNLVTSSWKQTKTPTLPFYQTLKDTQSCLHKQSKVKLCSERIILLWNPFTILSTETFPKTTTHCFTAIILECSYQYIVSSLKPCQQLKQLSKLLPFFLGDLEFSGDLRCHVNFWMFNAEKSKIHNCWQKEDLQLLAKILKQIWQRTIKPAYCTVKPHFTTTLKLRQPHYYDHAFWPVFYLYTSTQ